MPMRIFLSGTSDLSPFKRRAQQVAEYFGMSAWMDVDQRAPGSPRSVCLEEVRSCEKFFLFLGAHYGEVVPELGFSPTEDEYQQARAAGKPIYVFLHDLPVNDERQVAFLEQVVGYSSGFWRWTFKTTEEVGTLVEEILAKEHRKREEPALEAVSGAPAPSASERWRQTRQRIEQRFPQYVARLCLPTALPVHRLDVGRLRPSPYFIGRGSELRRVADGLKRRLAVNIFTVHGLGGVGKSELAKQVALSLQSENAFPDGYIWVTLNANQGTAAWNEIARAFDVDLSAIDSSDDKLAVLTEILHCVSPLIILDNADDPKSLEIARQPLTGQTLLITSRRRMGSVQVVNLDDLPSKEAEDLYWAIYTLQLGSDNYGRREDHTRALREIIDRLGGHPLSIEIVASKAAVRQWSPEESLADLRSHGIRAVVREAEGALFADERHDNMMKILSLAVEELRVPGGANYRGRTLFAVCGALCGEYFHFEELEPVLRRYLRLYEQQSTDIERQRQAAGMASRDPIRQLMGWEEPDAEEPLPEADIRGVNEIRQLLSGDPPLRAVFDRLVALRVVTKHSPRDEDRDQFRLHPLLRDYAWTIMDEHLSPNIWRAVASWTADKALNLRGQVGDQLRNFRFVLNNVCRDRNLPQEFVTVLSSLLPVLRQQGQWTAAIEILETGVSWLNEQGDKAALAETAMGLGDLLVRKGDLTGGRHHLEWARTLYLELGQPSKVAWVTYWLSGLVHRDSPCDRFGIQVHNLRYALENRILDVAVAESRDLGDLLDEWTDPDTWAALQRISFRYSLANDEVLNFGVDLLGLAAWFCDRGDVASAAQVHAWLHAVLKLKPSAEHSYYLLRRELRLSLVAGDLATAEDALRQFAALSEQLERKDHDAQELKALEAWLLIEKGDLPAAVAALLAAGEGAADGDVLVAVVLLVVCGLLKPGAAPDEALDAAVSRLTEAIRIQTSRVSFALYSGLIAADLLLRRQETASEALPGFLQALRYLEKTGSSWHRWLARLEPRVVEKVGLAKLQQLWPEGDRPFPPAPVVVLTRDLPPLVRSRRDGLLMRLVPAGLCIHEDKRLGEPGAVWLPPYYMDVDMVSRRDFLRFCEESGQPLPEAWDGHSDGPATALTHAEAAAYCSWAGKVLPHVYELQRAVFLGVDDPAHSRWLGKISLLEIGSAVERLLGKLRGAGKTPSSTGPWGQSVSGPRSDGSDRTREIPNEELPTGVTPAQLLGCEQPSEQAEHLVHLLATSLFLTVAEKEQILLAIPGFDREKIDRITWLLENERAALELLETHKSPRVEALVELRAREWRILVDRRLGHASRETVDQSEQEICDRRDPFAYAPPLATTFQSGFDLKECLAGELSPGQRSMALRFLERLATTATLTSDQKRSAIRALTQGLPGLYELLSIQQAMATERRTAAEAKELFTQNLVRLQKALREWGGLAGELERVAQGPEKLFAGQQLLFRMATNPYHRLRAWDARLRQAGDPAALLPPHPLLSFDEHHFLSLLSQSSSVAPDEKRKILESVEQLSQDQINGLMAVLEEERRQFAALPADQWAQLNTVHQSHWNGWITLLAEMFGSEAIKEEAEMETPGDGDPLLPNVDFSSLSEGELAAELARYTQGPGELEATNPFHTLSTWDAPLRQPGDTAALLPPHPLLSFDEHHFLNLLSQSISLTRGEKRSILKTVERLSQEQIDTLMGILEEERQKFSELPRRHWNQLATLHQKCLGEWASLLAELQGVEAIIDTTEVEAPADLAEGEARENDVNISNLEYSWLEGPFPPELSDNPFAQQPPCDAFLPAGVDIRAIIPAHPKIFFAEKRFLQALSGSISLTADEKQRIIQAIPQLTQFQIDELTKILLAERQQFLELEPSHWLQLRTVCEEHWSYWPELVHSLLPGVLELPPPADASFHHLDGSVWHWTSMVEPRDRTRWIAGGPEMRTADNPVRLSLRREADPSGERRSRLRGFRGVVPIVRPEDLQDLVPVEPTIV